MKNCKFIAILCVACVVSCVVSCGGKKNSPNLTQYGPVNITDPTQPTIVIQNCIPGEIVSCDGEFQYNIGLKSTINVGNSCSESKTLSFTFVLRCDSILGQSWSGSVKCTGTQSKLVEMKPVSFQNVNC